jgi:hypothetical protein
MHVHAAVVASVLVAAVAALVAVVAAAVVPYKHVVKTVNTNQDFRTTTM